LILVIVAAVAYLVAYPGTKFLGLEFWVLNWVY
jgi:hypothetical protein